MTEPLLVVEGLCVERGGRPLVQDLSLKVFPNEFLVLMGHNGSGKTTLALALAGLLPHQAGQLRWSPDCGRPAMLLQDAPIFPRLTVGENIAAGALGYFRSGVGSKRELRARAETRFPALQKIWSKPGATLSGGQRQIVGVARTVLSNAHMLILDEPSVGLAGPMVEGVIGELAKQVAQQASSALVIEHNPLVQAFATRLCVMRDGRLTYDGPADLLNDRGRLKAVYL